MKKQGVALILVVLMLAGFASMSSAETTYDKMMLYSSRTDLRIDDMIAVAQKRAEIAMITLSDERLDAVLNLIIDDLVLRSYNSVTRVIDKASTAGILVERSWVEVQIGTISVWVDPAKVVRY